MRKSCHVELPPNIMFKNERGPHVETDDDELAIEGAEFELGKRIETKKNELTIIMYEIKGLMNRGKPAHLTLTLIATNPTKLIISSSKTIDTFKCRLNNTRL